MTSIEKKIQVKGWNGRKFREVRSEVNRFYEASTEYFPSLKRKKYCKKTKGAHPFELVEEHDSSFSRGYSFKTYKCAVKWRWL